MFSIHAFAQDCNSYYYLQNNKIVEMTIYNKKGDAGGKVIYTVSKVSGNASALTATVNTEMLDKKGKSIAKGANNIKCDNGVMMMDIKMFLPQQQAEMLKETEATASNVYLDYPATMSVGDKLKDANFNMDMNTNGMKQSMSMNITDRNVAAKESVTTTAGTWECYKIVYKSNTNIKTMGIGIPFNMDVAEWFAPGFGTVKTESKYGSTVITSIK